MSNAFWTAVPNYIETLESLGLQAEDISYGNDSSPSILVNNTFKVVCPNSENDNTENEEFSTFQICKMDEHLDDIDWDFKPLETINIFAAGLTIKALK